MSGLINNDSIYYLSIAMIPIYQALLVCQTLCLRHALNPHMPPTSQGRACLAGGDVPQLASELSMIGALQLL